MKDKITKTIRRVIKTADYETLEVVSSIEREVEYSTPVEFIAHADRLRNEVVNQVADDLAMVCEKLGVSEKRAFVKSNRSMPASLRD